MASTKSVEAGRAFLTLTVNSDEFRKRLDKAAAKLQSFGASTQKVGRNLALFGAGLGAPLVGALKEAAASQDVFAKFGTVFGDANDEMLEFSKGFANGIGRAESDIAGFLSGFQDLLVPIGIDPAVARDSSKSLTELAVDLASFNNLADADVVRDLQAALTGSSAVMKKYGVVANAAAVKQELLSEGIDPKSATEAQKVFARYQVILQGTTAAQGDAVRTMDSFNNRLKQLKAAASDAAGEVGGALLEGAAKLAGIVKVLVVQFGEWAKQNAAIIQTYALVAVGAIAAGAAIFALGLSFTILGSIVGGISAVLGAMAATFAFILSPVGLAVAALTGLTVAFLKFSGIGGAAVALLREQFGPLVESIQNAFTAIRAALSSGDTEAVATALMASLRGVFATGVLKIQQVWGSLKGFFISVWANSVSAIVALIGALQSAFSSTVTFFKNIWQGAVAVMKTAFAGLGEGVIGVLEGALELLNKIFGTEWEISVNVKNAKDQLTKLRETAFSDAGDNILSNDAANQAEQDRIQSTTDAALLEVDAEEKRRRAAINAELAEAEKAAAEARDTLAQLAANATTASEDTAKTSDAGQGLLDKLAKLAADAGGAADATTAKAAATAAGGTFSAEAIGQRFAFGADDEIPKKQLAVAEKQLEVEKQTAIHLAVVAGFTGLALDGS